MTSQERGEGIKRIDKMTSQGKGEETKDGCQVRLVRLGQVSLVGWVRFRLGQIRLVRLDQVCFLMLSFKLNSPVPNRDNWALSIKHLDPDPPKQLHKINSQMVNWTLLHRILCFFAFTLCNRWHYSKQYRHATDTKISITIYASFVIF